MSQKYTVEDFRKAFPELDAPADLIKQYLEFAHTHCDPDAFGSVHKEAVLTCCAATLSLSPHGVNSRVNKTDETTMYTARWDELKKASVKVCVVI